MANNSSENIPAPAGQDVEVREIIRPKKELPFAFFSEMTEKSQKQFCSRTTDLLMQDTLFFELSPKPLPSRDQMMLMLQEYALDSNKAK